MSSLPLSYNIRNLIVRWKVTLLAIGGIALVVAVMLVLVAMSNGRNPVRGDDGNTGGLLPALKAARLPITSALRAG